MPCPPPAIGNICVQSEKVFPRLGVYDEETTEYLAQDHMVNHSPNYAACCTLGSLEIQ